MSDKTLQIISRKFYEPAIPEIEKFGVTKEQAEKEIAFAASIFSGSPTLQKCTAKSAFKAVIECSSVGLTLNPALKFAYLVPRWNSKTSQNECTLMPSYQGLVKLLTDTGSISQVECHLVYQDDMFDVQLGTNPMVNHAPDFFSANRKEEHIKGVYAVATLENGSKQIEVMNKQEIDFIRGTSESYKSYQKNKGKYPCVWVDHYGEMARKTVIKRLAKYLPKSQKFEKVAEVIEKDNEDYNNIPIKEVTEQADNSQALD